MKKVYLGMTIMLLLCLSLSSSAQQSVTADSNVVVPPLVKFGGTLTDGSGKALSGLVGVTFSLYKDEQGGAPLWIETQNVTADRLGHYSVLLGSATSTGLPTDLFASGEARWLGVQVAGEEEQPRTMLVAVPYAMKAGDAQTLGGLPASAFAMAGASAGSVGSVKGAVANSAAAKAAGISSATTGTGVADFIPLWTSTTNQGDSIIFQSGTEIGINTKTPGATLGVNGTGSFTTAAGAQALSVTQSASKGNGIVATTSGVGGTAISGTSSSTTSSFGNGIGVFGSSSNPIGYGVEGSSGNVGVAGNGFTIGGTTGTGVQGTGGQYGVYGEIASSLFPATQAGVYGTTASASATAYGVEGVATSSTGNAVGVYGTSSAPKGYGVEGVSSNVGLFGQGNYGVDAHGSGIAVKGTASVSGAYSGWFQGGPVLITGNANNMVMGDPGCGAGYGGLSFNTGTSMDCTNYTLLGQSNGATYINAAGTAYIHFRSNNNELAHIDNAGNMDIVGINGGGNLTVTGRVTSGNVIAAVTASNTVGASTCTGVLTASNTACAVPNMTLTKTTADPTVLVMVNIGGVVTDACASANFYLVVDGAIKALSTMSLNTNNSAGGYEIGNLNIMSLLDLSAGSHTFQVQQATDETNASCNAFTLQTTVSQGDGGRGSQRSLVVREF